MRLPSSGTCTSSFSTRRPSCGRGSPAFTDDLPPIVRRAEDATAALPQNPLLASWGAGRSRDAARPRGRSATVVVVHDHAGRRGAAADAARPNPGRHSRRPRAAGPPLPGAADERVLLEPDDRSLQVHACHGRARQVEVVRDAILHLLADDPTLEPRDIVVMCPDIEVFAPLIHATFGTAVGRRRRGRGGCRPGATRIDLHVRLADRSLRQTNPVLGVVAQAARPRRRPADRLAGARPGGARAGAPALPPRRRRPRRGSRSGRATAACAGASMRRSVPRTGSTDLRPTRGRRAGIACWSAWRWRRRGSGCSAECCRSTTSAAATSTSPAASPSFSSACARSSTRSPSPMPLDAWAAAIADAADSLTAAPGREAWQRIQLGRLLEDVVAEGTTDGAVTQTPLALPEIRALLADRLRGRPTRASFRTGHLTICTLVPMRSVPHRVVCLMGLDDGVFPRQTARDGDDLLLLDPHLGDRDARSEDRQLLLDALLAATDHLVITYAGRDERTNLRRPPAVPLGELLDVVDRTARFPDGRRRASGSSSSTRCSRSTCATSTAGALVPERTWSFDRVALRGCAGAGGRPGRRAAVPRRAVAARAGVADRTRRARQVRPASGAGVPSSAARRRRRRARRRRARRAVGRARRARAVAASGSACSRPGSRAQTGTPSIAAEIARGELPPDLLAESVLARVYPGRRAARRGRGRLRPGRRGERLRRREGGATGRSHCWSGRCPASAATSSPP